MIYFDTPYLAKCYLREPGADDVRALAAAAPALACCQIGEVELASVFHRHLREGKLTGPEYEVVVGQFQADLAEGVWTWLPMTPALLGEAARVFSGLGLSVFLRAADAIHLTCARHHGLREVYSNDRHLLAACEAFGLVGRNLLSREG